MRLVTLLLTLFLSLYAEPFFGYSDEPPISEKVIYSSITSLPSSLYKGQLLALTFKTLSTEEHFERIAYNFSSGAGLRLLEEKPRERYEVPYYYHTFYFQVTASHVRIPDTSITLIYSDFLQSEPIVIEGSTIDVITLNPPQDFANLIADDLQLIQFKANTYDANNNIILFSLKSSNSVISTFRLPHRLKQGFESNTSNLLDASFSYYTLVPKHKEELKFSYFNLPKQRFDTLIIPIIVDDDTVSTQSDLKPVDHRHMKMKLYTALGIAAVSLLMFLWLRRYFYLFIMVLSLGYSSLIAIPTEHACVKKETPITLLPMQNATVFETTTQERQFIIEGRIDGYLKIKLDNDHIGWIKDADLCTP